MAAVLLASATGGVILLAVWLTGGSAYIDDFQQCLFARLPGHESSVAGGFVSTPLAFLVVWRELGRRISIWRILDRPSLDRPVGLSVGAQPLGHRHGVDRHLYGDPLQRAFRLGRRLGLTVPNAMLMCLAATLNGWMFYWGGEPGSPGDGLRVDSLGLVGPGAFARPTSWFLAVRAAGILLYLLLTGGWPYAILMIGLVPSGFVFAIGGCSGRVRIWPIFAAWSLGLALASPAILTLVEYKRLHRAGKRK